MSGRVLRHGVAASSILGFGLIGCSAGGNESGELSIAAGSSTSVTAQPAGSGGQSTVGPNPGFVVEDDDVGNPVAPMGCQQAERSFVPKIPTVFLLVDRSATMFDEIGPGVTAWGALRTGALEVMRELESAVRFGFGAFSGQTLSAQMCDLEVPAVPPALGNYAAIAQLYEPLGRPTNPNSKETPTTLALARVAAQLRADTAEGEKYILFVTDGEPDFCDNGNALCPPDSVVGLLQDLAAGVDRQGGTHAPIQTLVFGIAAPSAPIRFPVLQNFANAGAGQPVAPLLPPGVSVYDPNALFYQCNGVVGWTADFATTGKAALPGQSIATYVADPTLGGTAPVYQPDPNDQAALTKQIRAALAGVKSCTFDLGEDGVKVDLARRDLGERARVLVNGTPVPFDPANGWQMLSETTVQLEGNACTSWRSPTLETSIKFDFPCDIFIPR